jgi:hypothetical protein
MKKTPGRPKKINNSGLYRNTRDMRYVTIVEGDLLQKVEYPVISGAINL